MALLITVLTGGNTAIRETGYTLLLLKILSSVPLSEYMLLKDYNTSN